MTTIKNFSTKSKEFEDMKNAKIENLKKDYDLKPMSAEERAKFLEELKED